MVLSFYYIEPSVDKRSTLFMLISMDASSIDMNISTYVFVSYTRKSYLTLDCSSLIKWGSVHYRV